MTDAAMNTYKATVRVAQGRGMGTMIVWAQVSAQNPIAARMLLETQYGRGNVTSVPSLVRSKGEKWSEAFATDHPQSPYIAASSTVATSVKLNAVVGSNATQSVPNNPPNAVVFAMKAAGLVFSLSISPPLNLAPVS